MSTPTAFVAGATGYTGREVVAELRRRGIETTAHVRPGAAAADTWRARFETLGATVDTTPWEPAAMDATIARVRPDYVFALLGNKDGESIAGGKKKPECVVSGGAASIAVQANGKTVYVCCTGCRDELLANPGKYVK